MTLLTIAFADAVAGDTLTFWPSKDNTLIESATAEYSNGAGDGIFCGRLGSSGDGRRLRAVLAFDLSAIPEGSTITSVSLKMWLSQGHGGNQTCSLYRLLGDWGEGTSYGVGGMGGFSSTNDATWLHRFYPGTYWNNPGGDFASTASASAIAGNSGTSTWSSTGLVSNVQYWIDNPGTNFGWMVRGNEVTLATAKKFISRNWDDLSESPLLTVTFTPPPPPACHADVTGDGTVNTNDLLAVINSWGPCNRPPAACPADVAPDVGDAVVNVDDLLRIINSWGSCP